MLTYPKIDPILLQIGFLKVHWYGVMYLVGFSSAWILGVKKAKSAHNPFNADQVSDLVFYGAIGVLLGGRIGYVLFYNFSYFIQHPLWLFMIWDGGMSFHGGLIGVLLAMLLFHRNYRIKFFEITDFIAPLVPLGLAAGRIGNFINGELWGRVTTVPWAMIFPKDPTQLPRHPSELYEFFLEGIVLFIILWIYSKKARPTMAVSGLFLLTYGIIRIIVEFFRQPDPQLGFIAFGWLTMGQLLSIPMVIIGSTLIKYAYSKQNILKDK